MRPHFSLQPVLDYRHTRVEALEVELGQLLSLLEQNTALHEVLRSERANLLESLYPLQTGDLDFALLNQMRVHIKLVEKKIEQQQHILHELERLCAEKRREMVQAKQEEEALITLRRKENERYQSELVRQEGRQQDDIYISQAFRRSVQINGRYG
jgi:flagellar export protein FliJ